MVKTRGVDYAKKKWEERVGVAEDDYSAGIADPKKDWKTETAGAEGRYEDGVKAGIAKKRFGKGVTKAGTEKWSTKTEAKKARWGEGVRAATEDYATGMDAVIKAIEATVLPPRYPAGDPRNIERVKKMNAEVSKALKG